MSDQSQAFEIKIISSADTTGFKDAAAGAQELTVETTKTTEATKDFAKADEKGAESTEKLTVKNNDLEKMLRILGRISPETGAAIAGIGAVGGAGVGVGIFAMEQLVRVMIDAEVQAEKVKSAARDAFVTLATQTQTAETNVRNAVQAIDDFWNALNRKSAQGSVSSAFNAELQQLRDMSKVLGVDPTAAEASFKSARAAALDASVAALTKELDSIRAGLNGPEAMANELELEKLKADKAKLADAYKAGESFKPTAESARPAGVLPTRVLTDEVNEGRMRETFQNIDNFITNQINQREELRKGASDKIGQVQSTIDRMTVERDSLRDDSGRQRTSSMISAVGTSLTANDKAMESGDVRAIREQAGRSAQITVQLVQAVKDAAQAHSENLPTLQQLLAQMASDNRQLAAQLNNLQRTGRR